MRKLTKVTVYSNGSNAGAQDDPIKIEKIADLREEPHYHYVICRDGEIHARHPFATQLRGLDSVDICVTGKLKHTPDQYIALGSLYMAITGEVGDLAVEKGTNFVPDLNLFGV